MPSKHIFSRKQSEHYNALLLSLLNESGDLSEICFEFTRASASSIIGYDIFRYRFPPESLGVRCLRDLLATKEDRHYGLPSTDQIYLFPCPNFNQGIDSLQGLVNARLGYYPKEKELYVFVNRLHNQIKIYHLRGQEERIYQYKLSRSTYDLPRCFGKMTYEKINRTSLVRLLDCPKKANKKNEKKHLQP